jgi:hypothetical protein
LEVKGIMAKIRRKARTQLILLQGVNMEAIA